MSKLTLSVKELTGRSGVRVCDCCGFAVPPSFPLYSWQEAGAPQWAALCDVCNGERLLQLLECLASVPSVRA